MVHLPNICRFRLSICHALAALAVCGGTPLAAQQPQQLIELRIYRFTSEENAQVFDQMMSAHGLAALRRGSVGPVGVFRLQDPQQADETLRYVLLPYDSPAEFVRTSERLAADEQLVEGIDAYLSRPKLDPVFTRIESSLLLAFKALPQVVVPENSGSSGARLFELRVYESHNELKAKMKVQMFNQGEIDIFHEVGLRAVFFGEALIGQNLPQLTYLLVHEDEDSMQQTWQQFLDHPDWQRMKSMQQYQDTVSKIDKKMLLPLEYSEIK